MGVKDGERFCDACGQIMTETEKLYNSGSSWVCAECCSATPILTRATIKKQPLVLRIIYGTFAVGLALGGGILIVQGTVWSLILGLALIFFGFGIWREI